jgi:peptidoglycan/LPS O-acetylase OafA/YrhL
MAGPESAENSLNPQRSRIDFLEGLRGLAVLLVVLFHAHVPGMPGAGWIGVNTFFVISGFIITKLLLRERERHGRIGMRNFFLRRVLRLVPALVAMLAVMALVVRLGLSKSWAQIFLGEALYATLQVHNWNGILFSLPAQAQFLSHAWSLSVEWQFYLIWPFVLGALLRWGGRTWAAWATAGLVIATCAWGCWLAAEGAPFIRIYAGSDVRVGAILAGCLVALLPHSGETSALRCWPEVALAMLAVLMAETLLWEPATVVADPLLHQAIHHPLASGAAAVAIHALARAPGCRADRWLSWPLLVWAGTISYGLYLWHWPVMKMFDMLLLPQGGAQIAWLLLVGAPLSVLAAWLSWRLIEAPCQALRHRFT